MLTEWRTEVRKTLLLVAVAVSAAIAATAVQAGDMDAGLKRAKAVCAECHVIAAGVGGAGTDGAPPFATVPIDLAVADAAKATYPRYVPD